MEIEGSTVVVTGASSGIGQATATEFARLGANIFLISRRQPQLAELAASLSVFPGERLVATADARDADAIRIAIAAAVQRFGGIDVLVNNAGIGLDATIAEGSLANMHLLFDVNVFGYIHCIQAVVPHMRQRRCGTIVNVSSVSGRITTPFHGIYGATKAAVNAITDALRLELEADKIRVINVYPGYTVTSFHQNHLTEVDIATPSAYARGIPASVVARKIVRAVRRGDREVFISVGDALDAIIKAVAPRLIDNRLRRRFNNLARSSYQRGGNSGRHRHGTR